MASSSGGTYVHGKSVAPGASSGPSAPTLAEGGILEQRSSAAPIRDARGEDGLTVAAGSDLPVGGQEIRLAKEPS
jgi:hypothetical protein